MSLSKVQGDEKIYVSGIFSLRRPSAMKEAGITHIVSALRFNYKETKGWENYKHLNIHVDDVDDEDIIQYFPETITFIQEALKEGGGVLVHCAMGKSRSVTLTAAYLLATRPDLTPESAVELIKETRPGAEPNSGFMDQLHLWQRAGCPMDVESNSMYQRWLYKNEIELSAAIGRAPDRLRFEDEEKAIVKAALGDSGEAPEEPKRKNLRCRKCRTLLGTEEYVVAHDPKESMEVNITTDMSSLPLPNPEAGAASLTTIACGHLFVQPLSWMRPALETQELEGRLMCPSAKCGAHVGRWNWKGLRCSCGVWITPAFALQKGRVDVLSPDIESGKAGVAGVRLPPGGIRMPPGVGVRMPPGRGQTL